jgi:hypothetical protein
VTELVRCDAEIGALEQRLQNGHPDVEGLCRALADWSGERRLLNGIKRANTEAECD